MLHDATPLIGSVFFIFKQAAPNSYHYKFSVPRFRESEGVIPQRYRTLPSRALTASPSHEARNTTTTVEGRYEHERLKRKCKLRRRFKFNRVSGRRSLSPSRATSREVRTAFAPPAVSVAHVHRGTVPSGARTTLPRRRRRPQVTNGIGFIETPSTALKDDTRQFGGRRTRSGRRRQL